MAKALIVGFGLRTIFGYIFINHAESLSAATALIILTTYGHWRTKGRNFHPPAARLVGVIRGGRRVPVRF